jgi:DNA-dependent metalloprotease WSS1
LAPSLNFILTLRNYKVLAATIWVKIGLNTGYGNVINIRLRTSTDAKQFYGMEMLMDTILHELCHNVHMDHDDKFYELLEQVNRDWELLSSKGYQGEGFFSKGQRLGSGHAFYKPNTKTSIATTAADRRKVKDAAERRGKGIFVGSEGRRLEQEVTKKQDVVVQPFVPVGLNSPVQQEISVQRTIAVLGGRTLGDGEEGVNHDLDPRQLAAMAAVQRARDLKARDQKRCGARQSDGVMRREAEKAQRESTTTLAKDIGKVVHVGDLKQYDLQDVPAISKSGVVTNGVGSSMNGFQSYWACTICTFLNPPLYLSCQVCQAERKMGDNLNSVDIPDDFAVSWDCRICTFKNENVKEGKCMVCGTEI